MNCSQHILVGSVGNDFPPSFWRPMYHVVSRHMPYAYRRREPGNGPRRLSAGNYIREPTRWSCLCVEVEGVWPCIAYISSSPP